MGPAHFGTVAALLLGATSLAGCAPAPAAPATPSGAPAAADPAAGLVAGPVQAGAVSPALAEVVATRIEAPVGRAMTVYRDPVTPAAAITVSAVTYADSKGALILYNGYFAERAFPAAAERRALSMGDEAELVEMAWPPLFTAYARQGPRFVLAEAAPALGPPERRRQALEAVVRAALTSLPGAEAAGNKPRETTP
jgi:hypothetical protein